MLVPLLLYFFLYCTTRLCYLFPFLEKYFLIVDQGYHV